MTAIIRSVDRRIAALVLAVFVVAGCGTRERTAPTFIPTAAAVPSPLRSPAASPSASPFIPTTPVSCPSNPPPVLPSSFAEGVPFTLCQELARVAFIPGAAPLRVSLELVQRDGRLSKELQIWKRSVAGVEYPDVTHATGYEPTAEKMLPALELRSVRTFQPKGGVGEHFAYTSVAVNLPSGFQCCTASSLVLAWDGCNIAVVMEAELIDLTAGGDLVVWSRAVGASRIQEGEVAREYRWTGAKYEYLSGPMPQPRPPLPSDSCRP